MTNKKDKYELRVTASAYIALGEAAGDNTKLWHSINAIMYDNSCATWQDAAMIYVRGGLLKLRRGGYSAIGALNHLENRQVQGDDHKPRSGTRAYGKVLGSMMTQYDQAEARLDPAYIMDRNNLQAVYARHSDHLARHFAEYAERLSPTRRKALCAIVDNDVPPHILYSLRARNGAWGANIARRAWQAYRLYDSYPCADSVDPLEWLGLLRQYVDVPTACKPSKLRIKAKYVNNAIAKAKDEAKSIITLEAQAKAKEKRIKEEIARVQAEAVRLAKARELLDRPL